MSRSSNRWLSYHLYLPSSIDVFLVAHLLPMVESAYSSGRVKRFFFLRYTDTETHLRIRFQPGHAADWAFLKEELERTVSGSLGGPCFRGASMKAVRLEEQGYDREKLYFGETLASVYSELLNEATSWFSFRLLRFCETSGAKRWLVVAAVLEFIQLRVASSERDFFDGLCSSFSFARSTAESMGFALPELEESRQLCRYKAIVKMRTRVAAALDADSSVRHVIALLARTRRCRFGGRSVAVHALHLLCNKVGLPIHHEFELFNTVYHLALLERGMGITDRSA